MNNFLHCSSFPLSQQRAQFPTRLAFASQMQKTWWWSLRYLIGRINNFCPCSCDDEQHEREQPLQDMSPLAFHVKREALQLSESDWKLFRTLFSRRKSVTWNLPLPHNPSQQSQQRTKDYDPDEWICQINESSAYAYGLRLLLISISVLKIYEILYNKYSNN